MNKKKKQIESVLLSLLFTHTHTLIYRANRTERPTEHALKTIQLHMYVYVFVDVCVYVVYVPQEICLHLCGGAWRGVGVALRPDQQS